MAGEHTLVIRVTGTYNPLSSQVYIIVDAIDVTTYVAEQNLFVQAAAPSFPPTKYMWAQTGLGDDGTDLTFWIEDGL